MKTLKAVKAARRGHRDGFTLIEAVVAIAVMGLLFLAFTLMVQTSARYNMISAKRQAGLDGSVIALKSLSNDEFNANGEQISLNVDIEGYGQISVQAVFVNSADLNIVDGEGNTIAPENRINVAAFRPAANGGNTP